MTRGASGPEAHRRRTETAGLPAHQRTGGQSSRPYCGSLLRIDWDGRFDSNILIRTVLRKDQQPGPCRLRDRGRPDPQAEADELDRLVPLLEALVRAKPLPGSMGIGTPPAR